MIKVSLQGGTQKRSFPDGTTKADMARVLLTDSRRFSVTEISQSLGAAYSQVHAIAKKEGLLPSQSPERRSSILYHTGRKLKPMVDPKDPTNTSTQTVLTGGQPPAMRRAKNVTPKVPKEKPVSSYPASARKTSKARVDEAKEWAGKKVDKLVVEMTGAKVEHMQMRGNALSGLKLKAIGRCANCGYELKAGKIGGQMQMIHSAVSPEIYLDKIQFCHAYPASLR